MDPSGPEVTMHDRIGVNITPLGLVPGNSRGHFEAADRTCRGRQWQPGESCCRRPNTSKFRYALINTSKLIPASIYTYLLINSC